ncbi:MAG: tetratricopeptide repeat protein, partial [bacterium]
EIADKHDGLVNRFNEEEVVLLFGIPLTREDDFIRAARAALELHGAVRKISEELSERIDAEIRIHSGIDAGMVVAQPQNGDNRFKLTGGPVQIAFRLAAEARKDEILVSAACQRLIKPFFDTEAREPFKIRGRAQSLTPFAIQGESGFRSRLEAIDSAKLTPFVGRDRELGALQSSLEKAINGDGQFVTVVGEAGLGKSRLLYEFHNQIDHDIEIKQGRCQSYGSNIPYLPFVELLKELLDIAPEDQNSNQSENIAVQIRDLDPGLEDYIPLFLHLLAIQDTKYPLPDFMQGDHIQHAIVEGLAAMITLAANRKPMVILLEDWHWVDDASQKIVKQLAEMVSNFPLCLIVTYRPEAVFEWGNPANHTRIQLAPLEASSSIGIMKSVLGANSLPEKLAALIHQRTGGNPFFVEEMSQTLQEGGSIKIEKQKILLTESTSTIHLPQTIQAVIRSRLDRLDPDAFEVLRAAAVIGREFTQNILENVITGEMQLRESLQALRNSGLIQQIHVLPEAMFRFKHILTQEVAYDSLLQHQRKALHGLVGEVLEKVYRDRLREQATLLMEHFSQAENWRKAVDYGCEAADHPLKLCQYGNGLNILDKVEAWISRLPEKEEREKRLIDVLLQKERACESLGYLKRQKQIIDQLLTLIDSEDIKRADVYIRLADLLILGSRFKEAEEALDEAIRMSRESHHKETELRALRSWSFLKCRSGDSEGGATIIQNVVEKDIQIGDATVLAQDLFSLFNIVNRLGDDKRVKKCLDDALALYDQVQPRQRSFIMIMAGLYYRDMGDDDKAISFFKKVHEIVAKYGGRSAYALIMIANIHLKQGNIEEALRYYKDAVDWARKKDFASDLVIALRAMGSAYLSLGRNTEALPYLQEAAEVYSRLAESENQASMLGMMATAFEKDGRHNDAFASWEKSREMCKEMGNLKSQLAALKGMARTTRHLAPDPSQALQYYHEALELAEQQKNRTEQGDILNSLAIIEWQVQHFEQALQHYENALAIFLKKDDQKHAGFILNSIAATLKKLDRPEEALSRLQEAIQIHQQVDQPLLEGHALAIEGDIYFDLKDLDRARESYENSLALRQKISDRKGEGWMSYHLAKVFKAQGSSKKSQDYAEKALVIAKECQDEELLKEVETYIG